MVIFRSPSKPNGLLVVLACFGLAVRTRAAVWSFHDDANWHAKAALTLVQTNASVVLARGVVDVRVGGGSVLAWAEFATGEARPDLRRRVAESAFVAGVGLIGLHGMAQVGLARAEADATSKATIRWLELAVSFTSLVIAFGAYGILQEYIMTQRYGDALFPSAAFLMFANRVVILTVSATYLIFTKERLVLPACRWAAIPAITNSISSWCQHSSLRFITFPTQMVFKSSKVVPTMAMNRMLNGKTHHWHEYMVATIVTACVIGFSFSSTDSGGESLPMNSTVGVAIMTIFIFCDALTSTGEKRIYQVYEGFSNMQMMLSVAFFSLLYSTLIVHFTVGFNVMFAFLMQHPEALLDISYFAVCSTVGQYLTYYIIRQHGPVILSIMMTIRQVISIYISALLFGHQLGLLSNFYVLVAILAVLGRPLLAGVYGAERLTVACPAKAADGGTIWTEPPGHGQKHDSCYQNDQYGTFHSKTP